MSLSKCCFFPALTEAECSHWAVSHVSPEARLVHSPPGQPTGLSHVDDVCLSHPCTPGLHPHFHGDPDHHVSIAACTHSSLLPLSSEPVLGNCAGRWTRWGVLLIGLGPGPSASVTGSGCRMPSLDVRRQGSAPWDSPVMALPAQQLWLWLPLPCQVEST